MTGDALAAITEDLVQVINQQSARGRVTNQHIQWQFPRVSGNLDGRPPCTYLRAGGAVRGWLDKLNFHDEAGHTVRVTPHQFRRTLSKG